jgi:hypothetical protein
VVFTHPPNAGYGDHQALGTCYFVGVVHDTGSNLTYTESMCDGQCNWCSVVAVLWWWLMERQG